MKFRNMMRMVKGEQEQRCPACDELIGSDSINIREGMALCPKCKKLSRLSELNTSGRSKREILSRPPGGCSIKPSPRGVVATASCRSITGFLGATAVALFWNGIVSIFVLIAIAGLYTNLIGPLPEWFPAPGLGEDGRPEMNDAPMGLGMTLFLCIFLTPFVLIGVTMIAVAIINLAGKVEVVIDEVGSWVATGVGVIKWKRRFDPRRVRSITFGNAKWQSDGGGSRAIELTADRTIQFGSMLSSDRMEWLLTGLSELLLPDSRTTPRPNIPSLDWMRHSSH